MFFYNSLTGEFKHDGLHLGYGYSGNGVSKNTPSDESVPMHGPIPRGVWTIGDPYNDPHLGPVVMHLDPKSGTNTFGRSLFRIHGDSIEHPGDASDGCVILPLTLRKLIAMSSERLLTVL
jgi:hypothetical protein